MKKLMLLLSVFTCFNLSFSMPDQPGKEIIETTAGKLKLHFLGHASVLLEINDQVIYIDPVVSYGDFNKMPKADLILITHEHHDHLDNQAVSRISKPATRIIGNAAVHDLLNQSDVMKPGDKSRWSSFLIEAVPAYNTTQGREKYHPKGRDIGFILTIGDKRVYFAGDTEYIPEMENLGKVSIAVLPMNQPYTMTPEQMVKAISVIQPDITYPYHTDEEDLAKLKLLLQSDKKHEVRFVINN